MPKGGKRKGAGRHKIADDLVQTTVQLHSEAMPDTRERARALGFRGVSDYVRHLIAVDLGNETARPPVDADLIQGLGELADELADMEANTRELRARANALRKQAIGD